MVEEVICLRREFFRFQAFEPVFTLCTDQDVCYMSIHFQVSVCGMWGDIWVICTSVLESTHTQQDYNLGLNETGSIFEVAW